MMSKLICILVISLFAFGLGEPDCSYTRKCQDLWTAKECDSVKECTRLWLWRTPTGYRDDVCSICLEMVKEARDTLRSNTTREELKEVFEGSCALLTLKPAVKVCDRLVDQFVPELVDILSSQMDPEVVCSVARLCNNADFRNEMMNSADCSDCNIFSQMSRRSLGHVSSDDFKNGLLDFCRTAGSYSDACSHLALAYSDFLFESARFLSESPICSTTFVCPSPSDYMNGYMFDPEKASTRMCPLCKTVAPLIRRQLLKVKSAEAFAENIFRICDQLKLSNTTCSQLSRPELYENLKRSEALPELFCRATYCKEKQRNETTPVWPLVSTSAHDPETDLLEFLRISDLLFQQKPQVDSERPKIAYGDSLVSPVFFGPDLTSKLYETDPMECETCHDVFDLLSKPARRDDDYLSKFLDVVCLMSKNTKKCDHFMEKFLPFVQAAFAQGGVTKEMCAHLPSCQAKRNEPALPEKCNLCLNVMQVLRDGNSSLIGPVLEQKCNILAGVPPHMCKELSLSFGTLASLLQNSNESEACSFVKLCPRSEIKAEPMSKPSCQTCMLTIQSLVDTLKRNSSDVVIEHVLDSLCGLLPHVEKRFCMNLIDSIGVEGFKKLIESLNPTEICRELHICKRNGEEPETTTAVVAPEVSTPAAVTRTPSESKKIPCKFCVTVIDTALAQLQDNRTEDAIRKVLENVCNYLPTEVNDTCRNLIDTYMDTIIDMIVADFNGTEICTFLKICPGKHLFGGDDHDYRYKNFDVNTNEVRDLEETELHETYVPKHVEEAFQDFQKVVQECAMCEALVGVVSTHKKMLNKNYDFYSNAYKICNIVPKDKLEMCTSMIVSYGPSIVNLLVDHKVDPNEVCVYLDLCDAQMQAKVNLPVSVPEPEDSQEEKNECLLGPAFWCANEENAKKCGTLLHCEEIVWKSWKSQPTRRSDSL